jgi:OOP family OmpA-OmpF porin
VSSLAGADPAPDAPSAPPPGKLEIRGALAAAHAVSAPQSTELGAGGSADLAVIHPITRAIGLEAGAGAVVLRKGAPPPPAFQPRSTGAAAIAYGGVRFHPFAGPAGLWLDATVGIAATGGLARPALGSRVGYDFRVGDGRLEVGPFAGYTQIVQPDGELRPEDARIACLGIQVGFGQGSPARAASRRPADEAIPVTMRRAQEAETRQDRDEDPPVDESVRVEGDTLVVSEIIHFDYDSPYIRMSSRPVVEKVARFLARNPDILEVSIQGHADAPGTSEYNDALSRDRADSVRTLMVVTGVEPGRLRLEAFGKTRLKIQTLAPEEKNRRVEFFVTRARSAPGKAP